MAEETKRSIIFAWVEKLHRGDNLHGRRQVVELRQSAQSVPLALHARPVAVAVLRTADAALRARAAAAQQQAEQQQKEH